MNDCTLPYGQCCRNYLCSFVRDLCLLLLLLIINVSSHSVYTVEGNDLCSFVPDSCSLYMLKVVDVSSLPFYNFE
jgi:hypothetical protein